MEDSPTFVKPQAFLRSNSRSKPLGSISQVAGFTQHQYCLSHISNQDESLRKRAKLLVSQVAVKEKGWPVGHYIDKYRDRSQLFAVLCGQAVVGTVLIIVGDAGSFPIRSVDSWPDLKLPPGSSAEIPFVVVDKRFRGSSGVSYMLCAACHWYFFSTKIDYMELTLDEQLLSFYLWHGMNMQEILAEEGGGRKEHWGEPGIFPARLFVGDPEVSGSMGHSIRMKRPEMWEAFLNCKLI